MTARRENEAALLAHVASALHGSAFRNLRSWPSCVVVVRVGEKPRITGRADHAQWLRANDLPALANECMRRKVPPGSVLVHLEADTTDVAGVGFVVFDVVGAVRRSEVQP